MDASHGWRPGGTGLQRNTYPPERRGFGRRESRIHAIARLPGRGPEPCTVQNFSDSGALLAFANDVEPPARFRLTVETKGIDVMCEVRRREGAQIGVSFLGEGEIGLRLAEDRLPVVGSVLSPSEPPHELEAMTSRLQLDGPPVSIVRGDEVRRRLLA